MTWQILETEPAFGICDQCKQHTCGITEDGKHKWIMTSIYDQYDNAAVIGYKCVESWAANLGISKETVVKEVKVPPTNEQLVEYLRDGIRQIEEYEKKHLDPERKPVKRK